MKLTVSQAQLAHGLGLVSRAVSPRSTLARSWQYSYRN